MNSNPILILLVLSSLETMPPTFTPLSFNTHANRIMAVVLPTRGTPVRTIIVVILLFLIGRGSRSRIHSATIASYVILSNLYLELLEERFDIRSVPFNDLIQKHCPQILVEEIKKFHIFRFELEVEDLAVFPYSFFMYGFGNCNQIML